MTNDGNITEGVWVDCHSLRQPVVLLVASFGLYCVSDEGEGSLAHTQRARYSPSGMETIGLT